MFGEFKLSSKYVVRMPQSKTPREGPTIWRIVCAFHIHVQILVPLQSLSQKLDLLVTLYSSGLGIGFALPIPFILVEPDHLFHAIFVLFFDAQFEL